MPGSHPPTPERDPNGYVDLRSYAAIGDGRTVALIARDGRVDWWPVPDLSSPPAFGALLDAADGGFIELRPDLPFTVERSYVGRTNVLATTFTTDSGSVRVTDSLNTGVAGRLPWAELGRRIDGLSGRVAMTARVRLGTCLNTASPWVDHTEHGPVLRIDGVTMAVRLQGEEGVDYGTQDMTATFLARPGSRQVFGVVATDREPLFLAEARDIDAGIDRTITNWSAWSDNFDWNGPFADQVRRSALALKMLIHAPTGAVAAAATTSLPEWPDGEKTWDYRFAWIRDMAYTLTALFGFGLREEIHAAISCMLEMIGETGEPQVAYRLGGGRIPGEAMLRAPGWRGIGPVRAGNRAGSQLQLGVFGDIFAIVSLYVRHGNLLDTDTARLMARIADLACDTWRSPDSGMWEEQDEQHYVTSKMGCWKALSDAVELAEGGHLAGPVQRWRDEADLIRAWVDEHGWSAQRGSYVWYPGSTDLDASIVLHTISGFDRGPRMSATLSLLRAELGAGPHLHRYTKSIGTEGTFVACSFWMVSALALVDRRDEATALMEQLVGATNDVGMLSEMIHPETGDFLGNLPQALSHLALIHAGLTLAAADHQIGSDEPESWNPPPG